MRAVVYKAPGDVEVMDVDTPVVGDGDVLLRVLSNTICGTDLRIAKGIKRKGVIAPRVLGHEVAGEVAQVGKNVTGVSVGDTVGLSPTFSCGSCTECQRGFFHLCRNAEVLGHQTDGGLADYLLVPARAVRDGVLVPYSITADPVAISLAEPLSCVIHGQRFLDISFGDVVLVIGGGAIGLMHARLAKLAGASTVIVSEPVEFRRLIAVEFGADVTVDPTTENLAEVIDGVTNGDGADVVIVCIGVPALVNEALTLARKRARVSLFAGFPTDQSSPIDSNLIHYKELTIVGSSNSTVVDYQQAVDLIERGAIDTARLVTHRFSVDQYEEAVDMINHPDALKVAIIPAAAADSAISVG
ncbi:MAG: zinc-binding dehydrogenase [Rhodoglobus sp.]